MIGTYVKDPIYGLGKVIKLRPGSELVYFFKADDGLHDGAIDPGSCPDNHGWWYHLREIEEMKFKPPLESLIEKRMGEHKMLGDYVEHSRYGIGKVIRVKCGTELVYFFKADEELHDGAREPGACPDNHGWWFESESIKNMRISHLRFLIEKRRESKKISIYVDYVPYRKEPDKEWEISINY